MCSNARAGDSSSSQRRRPRRRAPARRPSCQGSLDRERPPPPTPSLGRQQGGSLPSPPERPVWPRPAGPRRRKTQWLTCKSLLYNDLLPTSPTQFPHYIPLPQREYIGRSETHSDVRTVVDPQLYRTANTRQRNATQGGPRRIRTCERLSILNSIGRPTPASVTLPIDQPMFRSERLTPQVQRCTVQVLPVPSVALAIQSRPRSTTTAADARALAREPGEGLHRGRSRVRPIENSSQPCTTANVPTRPGSRSSTIRKPEGGEQASQSSRQTSASEGPRIASNVRIQRDRRGGGG